MKTKHHKGQIGDDEARAYVVEKGDKSKEGSKDTKLPVKPKPENVTLGMRKTKKLNEGVKRTVDEDEDLTTKSEKLRKSAPRKENYDIYARPSFLPLVYRNY